MGPVAQRVISELRHAPTSNVVDLQSLREARELHQEIDAEDDDLSRLPPDQATWMKAFKTLGALSHFLLGAEALQPLAKRIDEAEQYYMPGGLPMSPVLDSLFVSWWMLDLGTGPKRETLCSIIASAGSVLRVPPGLIKMTEVLGDSRLGVYRVTETGPNRVSLQDPSNQHTVDALLPEDLKSRGSLWLTRLLPPLIEGSPDWVVWTTPYLLRDPSAERDWLAYFERIAPDPADREELVANHFKSPPTATYWLDYVFDAYAGVSSEGGIILSGIADQPHTLPHSTQNEESAMAASDTPLHRVRKRLLALCDEHGFEEEGEGQRALRAAMGAPEEPLNDEVSRIMNTAYRMYGQLDDDGLSAVDLLKRVQAGLASEERAVLASLEAGWFSLFEVIRIRTDEGMELRDQLRRRRLWVSERMATRQAGLGDVLCGWVLAHEGEYTLEGALLHVPRQFAPLFTRQMREMRDDLTRRYPKLGWKKRAGLLAPVATAMCDAMFAHAPVPTLLNMDQDELVFSESRYEIIDRVRAKAILSEHFEEGGPGAFVCVVDDRLIAELELTPKHLVVRCNSRERLEGMKERLGELLDGVANHKIDSHEDLQRSLEESERSPRHTQAFDDPADLPPELREALHQVVQQHMTTWLDTPIPMLDGKSPRQAVRSEKGRDDVTHLLVRQQQGFNANPQMAGIDLSEIWKALDLSAPPDLAAPLDAGDYASIHEPDPRDTPPQARRGGPKIGRNDPCPCGSGKKFKRCCRHQTPRSPD
jgi:hypothetical protein